MERITRTLVLNLDFHPDRYKQTYTYLKQAGLGVKVKVERFSAVDGFSLNHMDHVEEHIAKYGPREHPEKRYDLYRQVMKPLQDMGLIADPFTAYSSGVLKPGTIGHYLSFFKIVNEIANDKDNDVVLVFEDDIIIDNPTEFKHDFQNVMENLPRDADIVQLGTSVFTSFVLRKTKVNKLYKIDPTTPRMAGTFAMIITRAGAEKIRNSWYPMETHASDCKIVEMLQSGDLTGYYTPLVDVDCRVSYTNSATREGTFANYKVTHRAEPEIKILNEVSKRRRIG